MDRYPILKLPSVQIALLLIILFCLSPFSNFNPVGSLDPWIYTGYFTNLKYLVDTFGVTYYVSRLPWIITGLIVHSLFAPIIASLLINVILSYLSGIFIYRVIGRYFGSQMAFLSAALLLLNPYYIGSIFWDYPDGASMTCLLGGASILLAPPSGLKHWIVMVLAGAVLAAAGFTNFISGMVIIPLLITYLHFSKRYRPALIIQDVIAVLAGVVGFTIIMGILSLEILHEFRFFDAQLRQSMWSLVKGNLKPYTIPFSQWIRNSYRLTVFVVPTVVSIICLFRRPAPIEEKEYDQRRVLISLIVFQILSIVLFAINEFFLGTLVLQSSYESSYLLVPTLLLTSALIGYISSDMPIAKSALTGSILVISTFGMWSYSIVYSYITSISQMWIIIGVLTFIVVILAISISNVLWIMRVAFGSMLVLLLTIAMLRDPCMSRVFNSQIESSKAAFKVQNLLKSGIIDDRRIRFWYDPDEPLANLFHSISSLYLWGYIDLTSKLPQMTKKELTSIIPKNMTLILISKEDARLMQHRQLLEDKKIINHMRGRWTVREGNTSFEIMLLDVELDSST